MYAREFERGKNFVRTFPMVFLRKIGLNRRNTIINLFVYLFAFAILLKTLLLLRKVLTL